MIDRSEQLISLFLQDPSAMTDEQATELSQWVSLDTANAREFIEASLFNRSIHEILLRSDEERDSILQGNTGNRESNNEIFLSENLWNMLLNEEKTAPKVNLEEPSSTENEKILIRKVKRTKNDFKINTASLLKTILSAAAMVLVILYFMFTADSTNVEVATLSDSVNAQWAQSSAPTRNNSRLMTNHEPLMLRKGYAEVVFDNDAKVVIEAPAEFQVLSYDQIKLNYGRLYATVPQAALGFIVATPTSKIIDMGTEFGVEADINGTTELHMVKGKASFVSGLNENKTNILVTAGSARRMSSTLETSTSIACNQKSFVRDIDSQSHFVWRGQNLNLADIVGGGNGFGTGQLSRGIDVATGGITTQLSTTDVQPGSQAYVQVTANPYIDGVFVPGIGLNPTQMTTSGLETDAFSRTSGILWGYIFNGAWHEGFSVPRHNLMLNGAVFGNRQNPAITMHSNIGITFDLDAIRQTLPGIRITSFSSVYGISETVDKWLKNRDFSDIEQSPEVDKLSNERRSTARFWVFLDGKQVFNKQTSSDSGADVLNTPIDETTRFLTLAVTEADDTFMFDWALFARPELVLELSGEQTETLTHIK